MQGGAAARGARACSFSKCSGCLLVSQDAPPGFRETWKGDHSSRGPTTHTSAADDHDGLRLQDQCLGWGAEERSDPPSTTTTAMTMAASTSPAPAPAPIPTVGFLRRRLPLLNKFVPLLMCSSSVLVELVMD
jgi:hypothetical protein